MEVESQDNCEIIDWKVIALIKKLLIEDKINESLDYLKQIKGDSFDINSELDENGHTFFHLACFFSKKTSSLFKLKELGCDVN